MSSNEPRPVESITEAHVRRSKGNEYAQERYRDECHDTSRNPHPRIDECAQELGGFGTVVPCAQNEHYTSQNECYD